MKLSPELQSLVDQMPDPDARGVLSDVGKEKMEGVIAQLHGGGRQNVLGLIELLVEPGEGNDIKPHHALHCLAVHVCGLEGDGPRREFALAVASQIGGDRPKGVQKQLIRQLQVAGGPEVLATLGKALLDAELCEPAAQALSAIGTGAAEQFRAALEKVDPKCRLTIVQNLGLLADAGSIAALKQSVGDRDREVRLAAICGLAQIADAGSVDLLLKAAEAEGWEGVQATDACLSLAENLLTTGKRAEAVKICTHLQDTRTAPDQTYIREAAQKVLSTVEKQAIP